MYCKTISQHIYIYICNCITTDETKPILVSEKQKPSERGKLNEKTLQALRENKTLIFRVEKQ